MTTFSVAEIRAVLAEVSDRLGAAYQSTRTAQASISQAIALLTDLDRHHDESLLPDELRRADDELTRGLASISGGADVVATIDSRL
jgi:hypothetical protein